MENQKGKLKSISDKVIRFSTFIAEVTWAIVDPHLRLLYKHMDEGHWTKRLTLYASFGISIYSVFWAFEYVENSTRSGTEIAAIIAAVMIPVNGLVAAVFKQYTNYKKPDITDHD